MSISDKILGTIADIALDAVRERFQNTRAERQARAKLMAYLARQQHYNLNCSSAEEIDFQGLAEYIRYDLTNDVEKRIFGTRKEREVARQTIADKAAYYAQAKTGLSEKRARHLAVTAVDILRNFYRNNTDKDLLLVANEIEDTVITEMTAQHQLTNRIIESIDKKVESNNLLSIDKNLMLADNGQLNLVEKNICGFFAALSTKHSLSPYYGFTLDGPTRLKSTPLRPDAIKLYPPHLEFTATSFKLGGVPVTRLDSSLFSRAYRSQSPIEFDVVAAKKYLGDTLDPLQYEAEQFSGVHMLVKPPAFPQAFPCSVIVDEETIVNYLLLRTKRIEDDGTTVLSNDEQINFNFRVTLMLNTKTSNLSFTITPDNPSNVDSLKYRQFLQKAMSAKSIALKSLNDNTIFISSKSNLTPHNFEKLAIEIEFLKKLITIENYFHVTFHIPKEITPEDHRIIHRLYLMIVVGEYCGTCTQLTVDYKLSPELRNSICNLGTSAFGFSYNADMEAILFDQTLCFTIFRKFDCLRIENFERLKAKLDVLDDGDILKMVFTSGTNKSDAHYSDTFYSEGMEKQQFPDHNS